MASRDPRVTMAVLCMALVSACASSAQQSPSATLAAPAAASTPLPSPTPTPPSASQDLHSVNWPDVIARDPQLDHRYVFPEPDLGPHVAKNDLPLGQAAEGFAITSQIVYAQLSDPARAIVLIPLRYALDDENRGLLIYAASAGAPVLVAALGGSHLQATTDSGELVVQEEIPQTLDPLSDYGGACGYVETRYRLESDRLDAVGQRNWGEPACRRSVVVWFYKQIKSKQYASAYAMLSPGFQSANPYGEWSKGYENTLSFSVKVGDAAGIEIPVDISATDSTPTGRRPSEFTGTWSLTWNSDMRRWVLDQANITTLPLTASRALDWTRIVESDPLLSHPDRPFDPWNLPGPYVAEKDGDPLKSAHGFAMVNDIFYGNIMGDPEDQAFVWLDDYPATPDCYRTYHSGLLIYRIDDGGPKLAAAIGGYELSAQVRDGHLTLRDVFPPDMALIGKCGNMGFVQTRYRWQENHLVPAFSLEVISPNASEDVGRTHYEAIKQNDLRRAYALLAPAYQAAHPFDQWSAAYDRTLSLDAALTNEPSTVVTAPDMITAEVAAPGYTRAVISRTDQTDAGPVTKHYTETWVLVPDQTHRGEFLLDSLEDVPSVGD